MHSMLLYQLPLNSDTPPGIYRVVAPLHQVVYYTLTHPGLARIQTQPPCSTCQILGVHGNFIEIRYSSALMGVASSLSIDKSSGGRAFLDLLLRRCLRISLRRRPCQSPLVRSKRRHYGLVLHLSVQHEKDDSEGKRGPSAPTAAPRGDSLFG